MFKEFFLKKIIKSQLKGMPDEQIDRIILLVEKNPKLFQKIGDEIKAKTKAGRSEMAASMEVMRMHQAEIQKVLKS